MSSYTYFVVFKFLGGKTGVDGATGAGLVSMERLSWDNADWLMAGLKNQWDYRAPEPMACEQAPPVAQL